MLGGSSSRFSTNESPLSSRTGVAPASHAPAHHVTVRQCGVIPRCTRAPGPASAVRKPAHLACHMLRTCPVSSMRSSGEYHVSHGREESAAEGRTRASASFMRRFKQKTGVVQAAAPRSRAAVPQGVGRGRRWGRRVSRGGGGWPVSGLCRVQGGAVPELCRARSGVNLEALRGVCRGTLKILTPRVLLSFRYMDFSLECRRWSRLGDISLASLTLFAHTRVIHS